MLLQYCLMTVCLMIVDEDDEEWKMKKRSRNEEGEEEVGYLCTTRVTWGDALGTI